MKYEQFIRDFLIAKQNKDELIFRQFLDPTVTLTLFDGSKSAQAHGIHEYIHFISTTGKRLLTFNTLSHIREEGDTIVAIIKDSKDTFLMSHFTIEDERITSERDFIVTPLDKERSRL
ncbi:nuclear transport factor 2 family protein [Guggenheimella bovis]